ncbi:hypothetical protein AM1_A0350 (plasmid) [Acaryochloris marina MBIC11017]|uniref:Uncharacterized protein n=1 Tax=Acaryochloris marina (strain MBIC 11017) TaxID=329726 RepID=A8ZL00_ACAM1|nr:hypothetical protein AM1_A0350 [Acaryochloris marina MBIC11017]
MDIPHRDIPAGLSFRGIALISFRVLVILDIPQFARPNLS